MNDIINCALGFLFGYLIAELYYWNKKRCLNKELKRLKDVVSVMDKIDEKQKE